MKRPWGWKRWLLTGLLSLVGLLALGAAYLWIAKPWVPPVVVSEPGPGGRRVAEDGLLANYQPGRGGGRRPAILLLGGSEGGIGAASARQAELLARAGYAVLTPSYFRAPGQSDKLELVPLERFSAALAWLRRQPDVDPARVAVVGYSKGAEAALLVAVRDPALRAVVAAMPSSVVWEGFDWGNLFVDRDASWSERGRPLPFLPYGEMSGSEVATLYRSGLLALPRHPDAVIPVERIAAPILLICGEADTLWPACPMARQLKARAGRRPVTLLAYRDAGHAAGGVPRAAGDPGIDRLGSMGGTGPGNNAARSDSWPKTLAFLEAALAP